MGRAIRMGLNREGASVEANRNVADELWVLIFSREMRGPDLLRDVPIRLDRAVDLQVHPLFTFLLPSLSKIPGV